MAMTMHVDIVSAEEQIFSGRATMLIATGTIGELGIMPGHTPLLTGIKPGPVRLKMDDGSEEVFFASGGFLEVQPGTATVLADTVLRAADVDHAAAEQAREAAEKALRDREADFDFSVAVAQLAEASARLRTVEELRKRRQ